MPEGFYAHAPHAAIFALYNATAVKEQLAAQYTSQILQQPSSQGANEQCSLPQNRTDQWWQYQAPAEAKTIDMIPAYGCDIYDLYAGPKLELDDPSKQLRSSRTAAT
jgi:hypothetical protein